MKIEIIDIKKFKAIISTVANLTDEASFKFTDKGLTILEMDPAHIALISVKMDAACFTNYVGEACEYRIDIDHLNKILKKSRKDIICIDFEYDDMGISFDGLCNVTFSSNEGIRCFNFNLIQLDVEVLKIPNLNFPVVVSVDKKWFINLVSDINTLDEVLLSFDSGYFRVDGKSDYFKYNNKIKLAAMFGSKYKYMSMFSVDYLGDLKHIMKCDFKFSISLGNEMPALFEFCDDNIKMWIILAPRVER